jgi:transcriptional regulator with XRE-family HTH domain
MNTESIHSYVIEQLQAAKGRWSEIAVATGISKRTIEKIAREEIPNPGVKSVESLARYFRESDSAAA